MVLLATGFGVGNVPFAPGTFGSLLAIPIFLGLPFLSTLGGATVGALVLAVAMAVWIAAEADAAMGEHDSGRIVVDEVLGMLVALAGLPRTAWGIAVAFVLFRVFDVVKVWPASAIDRRVAGGAGVVLDDVVSGIYANVAARLVLW
ncbi:MAG TPA: phosphatidylglycerophosphatase A [Candidatus Binatia bacterium]|nr:phosphatidylglycerophosphatase A [Candidatus Binatia bacterium]